MQTYPNLMLRMMAEMIGWAQRNLACAPAKPEAVGFVRMRRVERRNVPTARVHKLRVEIDPPSRNDRFEIA